MSQEQMQPRTIQRACGGWLAVAPRGARFSIGTTGPTEQEAIARFHLAWAEWSKLLDNAADRSQDPAQ